MSKNKPGHSHRFSLLPGLNGCAGEFKAGPVQFPVIRPYSLPDAYGGCQWGHITQNQENQISSSTCATKPADTESKTMQITPFANRGHKCKWHEAGADAKEHRRHMVDINRNAGKETSSAANSDRMPCSSSNCIICQTL